MTPPRILAGTETEYGLLIEGRGAREQIDDAAAFVRRYPGPAFVGWDYRPESPRADLRGFRLDRLAVDPEDARFDEDRPATPAEEIRSDRVLVNGARFYNDHGHPEYSTPEAWSAREVALHDAAGERVLLACAEAYTRETGRAVRVYKNNTDFHGAAYGTHESYLAPRGLGFEGLVTAVTPMLVARQILTGAGKVGAETGPSVEFQLSQRADFMVEAANAETLTRRPVFNTRDEPHADPRKWIRLHVITGDANRMAACTARRVGLVQLAVALAVVGEAPTWRLQNPVQAFQSVSRDPDGRRFRVDLEGANWTDAYQILESYFDAAEHVFRLEDHAFQDLLQECRALLAHLRAGDMDALKPHVDWVAKRDVVRQYAESMGVPPGDPALASVDLAYADLDPDEGLFGALVEMGEVAWVPSDEALEHCLQAGPSDSRAVWRGHAVRHFPEALASVSWSGVNVQTSTEVAELVLDPMANPSELEEPPTEPGAFVEWLRARGG